jgi:hypothetical protein
VTVNLKKGGTMSGTFLGADRRALCVEVEGDRLSVSLDDVASIDFTRAEAEQPAARAIEALKSLSVGTRTGANSRDYGNRFLEVKAVVEDQLPLIPEGDLREAVSDTLKSYELAVEIWEQASRSKPSVEAGKMTNEALSATWSAARKRLEEAEALLKRR